MIRSYKDLRVWQQSMGLVVMVYEAMNQMPKEELFSLTNQIKRAVVSVPSNIAEGHSRTNKDFLRFLRITQGSLAELETQLILTTKLQMLKDENINPVLSHIVSIKKQMFSLMNKIKESIG